MREGVTGGQASSNLHGMPLKSVVRARRSGIATPVVPTTVPNGRQQLSCPRAVAATASPGRAEGVGWVESVRQGGPGRSGRVGRQASAGLDGQVQQLLSFTLGQSAPDAVRLVHLEGVGAAGGQRRAFQAHGLRRLFPTGPGRPAFAFGMEEERACHPAAGGMQLPVPHIGIRPGKTPGIGHGVAHLHRSPSSTNAVQANIGSTADNGRNMARSGRIRIDIDAAVIKTLGPSYGCIKSRDGIFQDRLGAVVPSEMPTGPGRTRCSQEWSCSVERIRSVMNGWCLNPNQRPCPRSVVTIGYRPTYSSYSERRTRYTPSKLVTFVSWFGQLRPIGDAMQYPNGCYPVGEL